LVQAAPYWLGAGLAVAFAGQEAADLTAHAYYIVDGWYFGGELLFRQEMGSMDVIGIEEQCGIQIRAIPSFAHQVDDAPADDHEQRQRTLEAVDGAQLQGLDFAAVLENVEEYLDFSLRPGPVDQFDYLLMRAGLPDRQQSPLNGFGAGWCLHFTRYQTSHRQSAEQGGCPFVLFRLVYKAMALTTAHAMMHYSGSTF
jgi:hypothetical protein